jgi:hypothetical protein
MHRVGCRRSSLASIDCVLLETVVDDNSAGVMGSDSCESEISVAADAHDGASGGAGPGIGHRLCGDVSAGIRVWRCRSASEWEVATSAPLSAAIGSGLGIDQPEGVCVHVSLGR